MQRTQITFSSDKASLPRTRHNNVSRAILSLKAACSTLDLVRATCQYPSLSVFSVKGYERRGRREGINISRELITALDRYKVCIRERERSRKSIAQPCLRAKCLPRKPAGNVRFFTDAFYMQSVAFARVSRVCCNPSVDRAEPRRGCRKFYCRFIAANLFRNSPRSAKYLNSNRLEETISLMISYSRIMCPLVSRISRTVKLKLVGGEKFAISPVTC